MSELNMFEKAARTKLRFDSVVGMLTVEDLFDLPLAHSTKTSLDSLAVSLHNKLNESKVGSFVNNTKTDDPTQLKFDIVMHVLNLKVAERAAREVAVSNKAKKDQLLALIAQKETENLSGMSLEDLKKMAESM